MVKSSSESSEVHSCRASAGEHSDVLYLSRQMNMAYVRLPAIDLVKISKCPRWAILQGKLEENMKTYLMHGRNRPQIVLRSKGMAKLTPYQNHAWGTYTRIFTSS